jgi:PilZ domain
LYIKQTRFIASTATLHPTVKYPVISIPRFERILQDTIVMGEEFDKNSKCSRQNKRYKISLRVAVAKHSTLLFETAVEISKGGLLLKTNSLPMLYQILELRFFLPNREFVSVKGEIVYLLKVEGQHYAGIRFEDSNPELDQWLTEYADHFD